MKRVLVLFLAGIIICSFATCSFASLVIDPDGNSAGTGILSGTGGSSDSETAGKTTGYEFGIESDDGSVYFNRHEGSKSPHSGFFNFQTSLSASIDPAFSGVASVVAGTGTNPTQYFSLDIEGAQDASLLPLNTWVKIGSVGSGGAITATAVNWKTNMDQGDFVSDTTGYFGTYTTGIPPKTPELPAGMMQMMVMGIGGILIRFRGR